MSIDIEISGETRVSTKPYKRQETVRLSLPIIGLSDVTEEYDIEADTNRIEEIDGTGDYISRCHYGALVINTNDVFIADVDISESSSLPQLRTKKSYIEYFDRMSGALRNDFVVYETCRGFRVIMISDTCDPTSKLSKAYMDLFLADKLYSHNCEYQKCYRARLTPKPTRVGLKNLDEDILTTEENWIKNYKKACEGRNVAFLHRVSNKLVPLKCNPKALRFLCLHDEYVVKNTIGRKEFV